MSTSKTYRHRWAFTTGYRTWSGQPPYQELPGNTLTTSLSGTDSVSYGPNYSDWKRRLFLGQDATTSLSGTKLGPVNVNSGTITYVHNGHTLGFWYGQLLASYISFNTPAQINDPIADSKARSKLLSHYIEHTNTWRGGNFLAEVRETIHMLRHPVKSLFDSTFSFARKVAKARRDVKIGQNFLLGLDPRKERLSRLAKADKRALSLKKDVSDAWLTWAFGVKPLIADCDDAMSALNKVTGRDGKAGGTGHDTKIISGHGRNTTSSITPYSGWNGAGPAGTGCTLDIMVKTDYDTRYRMALRAHLEDSSTVAQQFGVGAFDAVPAVWEAIPWSFFIDYFVNVQEMIDSCRLWAVDPAWCYRSVRNAGTRNLGNLRTTSNNTVNDQRYVTGGHVYTLSRWVSRAAVPVPMPSWRFSMPGLDSMKWLNIAALKEQVFHASGKRF